jgi:hypothetical protein
LPGHYKIDFNWDTSNYPDDYFVVDGTLLALTGSLEHLIRVALSYGLLPTRW